MKAFVLEKYGSPFKEADLPDPVPGPDQVLVKLVAAGVNHADERTRAGEFKALFHPALPAVAGGELSGEVVRVGEWVKDFRVGDPVFGYTGAVAMGAFAEVATVDASALAHAPGTIPLAEAAALPVVALTAWQALVELGGLRAGQRVLVHGGSGGVGSVAIQLARHLGATVVATASARNADFVTSLGADQVIDYRSEDFVQVLGPDPVDLVLDTQGGEVTRRSLEVVRRGGVVVGIAGTPEPSLADQVGASPVVRFALALLSMGLRRRARKRGVTYRFLFIQPDGAAMARIAELVDSGVIRPVVGKVLPFARTLDALALVLSGGTRGKVLVSTSDDVAEQGEVGVS